MVPQILLRAACKSVAFAQLDPSPVPLAVGLTCNLVIERQIVIVKVLLITVGVVLQILSAVKTHVMMSPCCNAMLLYVELFVPTLALFKSH